MALADEQLDRLEEYLDGALPPIEADAVRLQLASDPAWSSALDRLAAARAMRGRLFASYEGDDAAAEQLAARIVSATRRQRGLNRYLRVLRVGFAAAACIGMGVVGGWVLRDRSIALHQPNHENATLVHSGGHPDAKVAAVVSYQVELTDESGRVTAVQKFDSMEKAREFADDLGRWQDRQRQMRNGAAVLVADKF